jgi:hypothetical protein
VLPKHYVLFTTLSCLMPQPLTNQAVQCQGLSENEDQDHTHKQLGLLRVGPAAGAATGATSTIKHSITITRSSLQETVTSIPAP